MGVRLLMVDNFDSFTFMLSDYLQALGAEVEVVRHSVASAEELLARSVDAFVISPGPGGPEEAGVSVELARRCIAHQRPLLGVCLGHQAIARACGQAVGRTPPIHGKTAMLRHDASGLFRGLPTSFAVTRYHSLAVAEPVPPLVANAWSEDGTVMAMRHTDAPVHGVQFHPESIATEQGKALLANFLVLANAHT